MNLRTHRRMDVWIKPAWLVGVTGACGHVIGGWLPAIPRARPSGRLPPGITARHFTAPNKSLASFSSRKTRFRKTTRLFRSNSSPDFPYGVSRREDFPSRISIACSVGRPRKYAGQPESKRGSRAPTQRDEIHSQMTAYDVALCCPRLASELC